jgi:hypothetical protein
MGYWLQAEVFEATSHVNQRAHIHPQGDTDDYAGPSLRRQRRLILLPLSPSSPVTLATPSSPTTSGSAKSLPRTGCRPPGMPGKALHECASLPHHSSQHLSSFRQR